MSRPIVPALGVALGVNALVASYLTYREQLAYARFQVKLRELQRQELHQLGAANGFDARTSGSEFV